MNARGSEGSSAIVLPDPHHPTTRVIKCFLPKGDVDFVPEVGARVKGLYQAQREAHTHAQFMHYAPTAFVSMVGKEPAVLSIDVLPVSSRQKWRQQGFKHFAQLGFQYGGPDLFKVSRDKRVSIGSVVHAFPPLMQGLAPLYGHGMAHNDISIRNIVRCPETGTLRLIDCALGGDTSDIARWMHTSLDDLPVYDMWSRDFWLYQCHHHQHAMDLTDAIDKYVFRDWKPKSCPNRIAQYLKSVKGLGCSIPTPFDRSEKRARQAVKSFTTGNGYPGPRSAGKDKFSAKALEALDVFGMGFSLLLYLTDRYAARFKEPQPTIATLEVLESMCHLDPTRRPTMAEAAIALQATLRKSESESDSESD